MPVADDCVNCRRRCQLPTKVFVADEGVSYRPRRKLLTKVLPTNVLNTDESFSCLRRCQLPTKVSVTDECVRCLRRCQLPTKVSIADEGVGYRRRCHASSLFLEGGESVFVFFAEYGRPYHIVFILEMMAPTLAHFWGVHAVVKGARRNPVSDTVGIEGVVQWWPRLSML